MAMRILSTWKEVGEWWAKEPGLRIVRFEDEKGVRRETRENIPPLFDPSKVEITPLTVEDNREDWSLRSSKRRDEKVRQAVHGTHQPLSLSKGFTATPYAPLHVASGYSFGRGVMLTEELVQFAANAGLTATAITDHFSLAGAHEFAKFAKSAGIKPIIGASFTLESGGELVLLAKNANGYRYISKLISICHLNQPRSYPLLLKKDLTPTKDVICLTGGHLGPLLPILMRRDYSGAKKQVLWLRDQFGADSVFLEIERSHHPFDILHEKHLLELSQATGIAAVAGGLVTHARPEHFAVQDVITCAHTLCHIEQIRGRKPYRDESQLPRFHLPERAINAERFLRDPREMFELFAGSEQLVCKTLEIAEMVDPWVLPARTVLPRLYENPENVLQEVTWSGAYKRYPAISANLKKRLSHELSRITRLGYASHFLCAWDMCLWATEHGISFSGRGSVVDSVVSYCLGFSRIDAFRHNLHFDRFLPEDGSKRPDIDIDFPAENRNNVRGYLTQKYGVDRTATVAAFGSYNTRGIIRDVGTVFGLPNETISFIAKHLHGGIRAKHLEQSLKNRPELRDSNIPKETLQWVFALAERMMDIPKGISSHSSGVVISSEPIWNTVPVMHSAAEHEGENIRIIQWDKRSAKHCFDKFDILCLRGQDVLQGTERRLKESLPGFNASKVPVEDESAFATMRSGHLIGIPQSASPAMRQAHIRIKTKNLDDASLVQAGIRPGVGGAVKLNELIARRAGKPYSFSHPLLQEILGHTHGIIVFQEQVDLLLQTFAGYSSGEAEDTRELIHKKRREDFGLQIKDSVMARIQANGYSLSVAEEVFELIAGFKGYGFAQGHALAFSEISLRSVYLQQHYPSTYFAALLDAQPAGYYGPCTLAVEARSRGVKFLPPCVNCSNLQFLVEDVRSEEDPQILFPEGGIRVALKQISGVSAGILDRINSEKPFVDVFDFALRVRPNRDELETLILCGALDSLHPNRRELLWTIPRIQQFIKAECTPGTLPLDSPTPKIETGIKDFNDAEKIIYERKILGLDVAHHLMSFERDRVSNKGGFTTSEVNVMGHGEKAMVVGNPIRLRFPPTPSGKRVVFFDLEDETGILNVTCFDAVYQRCGHAIVCAPYVTVIGTTQIREGHLAFIAKSVFPYSPNILKLIDEHNAPTTGKPDMGWGAASLPVSTADFLVG
jgi:error-prone DNA polymerase